MKATQVKESLTEEQARIATFAKSPPDADSPNCGAMDRLTQELRSLLVKYEDELGEWVELDHNSGNDSGQLTVAGVELDGFTYVLCRMPTATQQPLSQRQREIALLVADGLPNKTIACRLGISSATVAVHLQRIFRKLNIDSRTQLARQTVLFA